jgi:hypothetical protein
MKTTTAVQNDCEYTVYQVILDIPFDLGEDVIVWQVCRFYKLRNCALAEEQR